MVSQVDDDVFEVHLTPFVPVHELPEMEELKDLKTRGKDMRQPLKEQRTRQRNSLNQDEYNGVEVIVKHHMTPDGKIIVQPKVIHAPKETIPRNRRRVIRRIRSRIYHVPANTAIESVIDPSDGSTNRTIRRIQRY